MPIYHLYEYLLGNSLEVSAELTALLNSLLASLNGALKVTLLELGSTKVVEVRNILVQLPRLVVMLDSLVKLSLLVEIITDLLLSIGLFLCLLLRNRLLVFRLGLGLRFRLLLLLGSCGADIGHGHILFGLRGTSRAGTLGRSAEAHVNTQQNTHHLQEARVLDLLANVVGVLLDALKLSHEVGIGQKLRGLGVAGQLLEKLGVVENSTESAHRVASDTVSLGFGINGPLDGIEAVLGLVVGRLELQGLLISIVGGDCRPVSKPRLVLPQ
ncbi:hypothetical protein BO94DRAFT_186945 [Aspergillus sclerotioniger CBS 115572]|uniref:Uncharacterized protein n=1 Tax=Aspergillus sclerotioniger CBS 115572 TaxID=1450535 RepID=A0A317VYM2_9EURO|nr:hypothetical protein BO94DRAFT_186945 [Aspergillus sclerotioniger CBS 115572]PWY78112.1 hypothetical protein BO94DRAFT_186945 [Aspergillus sclerotioniger CBS 115572]